MGGISPDCRLAEESEGTKLDRMHVEPGVRAVLADPRKGRYFVASSGGRVMRQLMHTYEWSDWRKGDIWWLQNVYVLPGFRRQGIFRALFDRLRSEAEADPGVVACASTSQRKTPAPTRPIVTWDSCPAAISSWNACIGGACRKAPSSRETRHAQRSRGDCDCSSNPRTRRVKSF